ncbi:MAG: Fic/DOC family N-terminal domain-containing protein [Armatimonadota bacterium]|nr:Fic/DOC family N-terminal domain-containing protein [Armatimonadota bacterium]
MNPYVPDNLPLRKEIINWAEHVTLIGNARAALARFNGVLQAMPNPQVLLSPLATQEAVLSSKIEGTITSMEEVLEFEASPTSNISMEKRDDLREVINYRQAIRAAVDDMNKRPLCLNLIRDLHCVLMSGSVRGQDKMPGEIRINQNYIAPPGAPIEQATFIPPSPENVSPSLHNWEEYLYMEEKDPLVQLALLKAQFELIHPFCDGNGRMGRMLIPLILYDKKLLSSPVFYLSAYLERNHEIYYERLKAISRDGDWNGWIAFFLQAVVEQSEENSRKAKAILDLYNEMKQHIRNVTHSQFGIDALDAIFDSPIFKSSYFIARSNIPRGTALRILRLLVKNSILFAVQEQSGRTPSLFCLPSLLGIAEDL